MRLRKAGFKRSDHGSAGRRPSGVVHDDVVELDVVARADCFEQAGDVGAVAEHDRGVGVDRCDLLEVILQVVVVERNSDRGDLDRRGFGEFVVDGCCVGLAVRIVDVDDDHAAGDDALRLARDGCGLERIGGDAAEEQALVREVVE